MSEDDNDLEEKTLVLCKTYPTVSRKYESLVCSAGITEKGDLRRIYPVPWKIFWNQQGFKKKHWIIYTKKDDIPSDQRQESRKIVYDSIKDLEEAPFSEINGLIEPKVTTLEKLHEIDSKSVSLGLIKPFEITDLVMKDNENYDKNYERSKQTTLMGNSVYPIWIPPKTFSYNFKCCPTCKGHTMMCEDWELFALYRNYKTNARYSKMSDDEIHQKIRARFVDDMKNKKDLYFMVGTHFRFPTYIIISVIYPKKNDRY